ncbi:MAG: hypothetical protein QXT16_08720 [Candidatus Caldarchaeum sp.]
MYEKNYENWIAWLDLLRNIKLRYGISYTVLAKVLGTSPQNVKNWISGTVPQKTFRNDHVGEKLVELVNQCIAWENAVLVALYQKKTWGRHLKARLGVDKRTLRGLLYAMSLRGLVRRSSAFSEVWELTEAGVEEVKLRGLVADLTLTFEVPSGGLKQVLQNEA